MTANTKGFTLTEIIVGSTIASVVLAGTMSAFVTAARIHRAQNGPMFAEAAGYAQDTLETVRNHVAADDSWFANQVPGGWKVDPDFPGFPTTLIKRIYRVDPVDCDGDGTAGDCFAMTVKVCWTNALGSCP